MLDLFDPGILDILRLRYRDEFDALDKNAQLALAITLSENRLTHARLCELSDAHPSDVSKILRLLVEKGFLSLTGSGRGAVYRFSQVAAPNPDDVFEPVSSTISPDSSTISVDSSTISSGSSTISSSGEPQNRDEFGRLIAKQFHLPFVDSIETLTPEFLAGLERLAAEPRAKKWMEKRELEEVIVSLCEGHFITIKSLAQILGRGERTLRQEYLSKLCKDRRLRRAFPDTPNHEKQAYTKA